MRSAGTTCPPESMLSDFGLGKLDEASADTVSQHLETCADCQARVAALPGDSFVGQLRQAGMARRQDGCAPGETLSAESSSTEGSSSGGNRPRLPETNNDAAVPSSREAGNRGRSPYEDAPHELANHPDYELIKELGQGGMGTVYLAKNRMMDRPEVLKVISKALLDRPGALERFQQEIRSAAKLAHPNIVAAYSVLRPGDLLVFAMEYVKGQDLSEVVKARGPLPVANAAFYIHQVALGLHHAHEKGMVHRDIKPNNLMLAIEGKKHVVKILDFGLAKASSEKGAESGLTKSGQMLGTPDYVAPEQTLDAHKADIRADIYSLGCTLYFLLSGGPPFQEQSLFEILQAHHTRDARPLNLVRPEVPIELAAVAAKMMAKKPEDRYQTPAEVAKALVPFFKPGQSVASPRADATQSQLSADTVHGLGGATPASSLTPPPTPFPVPVAVPLSQAEPAAQFSLSIDTRRSAVPKRGGWPSLPPWQRWALAIGTAAAALLLGIVLLIRTPKGTIELDLSDPNANVTVTVDGNHIDVVGLDEPLSLNVGEHQLTVKGADYEAITKRFKLIRGENAPLTIKLVRRDAPHVPASPDERRPPAGGENVTVVPPVPAADDAHTRSDGFVSLFNGKDLAGWKRYPGREGLWRVDKGILIGSGPAASYLFSERGNFTNFHLRVESRINDGGNSGVYARSAFSLTGWGPDGYEAQINSTASDKNKTGSLYKPGGPLYTVATSPVPPNEWFTLELVANDNRIVIKVNGQETANYPDPTRSFTMGHIALQQHDPRTVVEFRKIEIKELQSGPAEKRAGVPSDAQEFGGHWYKFYPERLSWKAARDRCQSYGGQLVVIDSLAGNAFVGGLVEKAAWQDTWIGATDEAEEGKWRNVRGELLNFTNWLPLANQPNNKNNEEHYALISNRSVGGNSMGWRWSDQPNESKELQPGFVCEWDTKAVSSTTPRATPSGNDTSAAANAAKPAPEIPANPSRDAPVPAANRFACQIDQRFRSDWSIHGNQLVQNSVRRGPAIKFGDPKWGGYDFSVETQKLAGNDVVVLAIGHGSANESFFYGLGANNNKQHDTGYSRGGKLFYLGRRKASLERGRWYRAEVRVRGNKCECFLDGERLFAFTAKSPITGPMGLSANRTSYRFRNIAVKAPDGTVLLEGLPDLEHAQNLSNVEVRTWELAIGSTASKFDAHDSGGTSGLWQLADRGSSLGRRLSLENSQ